MKKLLIATAALAMVVGTAQAQSSVTVYGIVDMGYSSQSTTAVTAAGAANGATTDTVGINNGAGLSGSRLGFRGTEDLGGGLSAGFTFETVISTETGYGAVRQGLLSLTSKSMGSLNFGRGNTLGKNANDTFTAFGGGGDFAQGSVALEVVRGGNQLGATADASTKIRPAIDRASNQVTYVSPAFSGFTVAAQLVEKSVDSDAAAKGGETSSSGTAFQLSYASGPIAASYTRTSLEGQVEAADQVAAIALGTSGGPTLGTNAVTAAKSDTTVDQFGVTYTAGAFKVFGLYNDAEYQATAGAAKAENKGYDIGATYTMGKTTLLASFGDGEMKAAGATTVTDVEGMQAQVRYALSKRTTAYAIYGTTEYKGATKGESDVTMIGVRHTF
jgi:predicted porin